MNTYIYKYIYIYVIHIQTYICICICIYIYMYTPRQIKAHTHTHTHKRTHTIQPLTHMIQPHQHTANTVSLSPFVAVATIAGVNRFNVTDGWTCAHTADTSACSLQAANLTSLPSVLHTTPIIIQAFGLHVADKLACRLTWSREVEGEGGDFQIFITASNFTRNRFTCEIPNFDYPSVVFYIYYVCACVSVLVCGCLCVCTYT